LLVLAASPLNELGREHWRLIASQNYFDRNGAFISAVYSAPLLCMALLILVRGASFARSSTHPLNARSRSRAQISVLYQLANAMIITKRAQFQHERRMKAAAAKAKSS